jgi:hypothetical protein
VWWPDPALPGANPPPCFSSSPPSLSTMSTGGRAHRRRCPPVRRPAVARPPPLHHRHARSSPVAGSEKDEKWILTSSPEDGHRTGPPAGRGSRRGIRRAFARMRVRISLPHRRPWSPGGAPRRAARETHAAPQRRPAELRLRCGELVSSPDLGKEMGKVVVERGGALHRQRLRSSGKGGGGK